SASPRPVAGSVPVEVAEDASARRRRHAVKECKWERCEPLLRQSQTLQPRRPQCQRHDGTALALKSTPVVVGNPASDRSEPFPRSGQIFRKLKQHADPELQEAQATKYDALNLAAEQLRCRTRRRPEQRKPVDSIVLGHGAREAESNLGVGPNDH